MCFYLASSLSTPHHFIKSLSSIWELLIVSIIIDMETEAVFNPQALVHLSNDF